MIAIEIKDGETALDIARRHEAADIIQILEESLQVIVRLATITVMCM